jgi:hypothetical protein
MARTISDQDRARAKAMMKKKINESSRTISDADRARVEEIKKKYAYGGSATKKSYTMPKSSTQQYIQRNDGGIASKTRIF